MCCFVYATEIADDEDGVLDPSPESDSQPTAEEPSASVQRASSEPTGLNRTDTTMSQERQ